MTHDDIRRDRRNAVVRIGLGKARHRGCERGVEANHGTRSGSRFVERAVQKYLLRRRIAGHVPAVTIDLRDAAGIEKAETGIRRGDREAILNRDADVSGRADRKAALEKGARQQRDVLAEPGLAHAAAASFRNASAKKSGAPKFPDFRASARGRGVAANRTGTPGSISGPIVSASSSSADTTAPEVSPPATTRRRMPFSTRQRALAAKSCSNAFATCPRP